MRSRGSFGQVLAATGTVIVLFAASCGNDATSTDSTPTTNPGSPSSTNTSTSTQPPTSTAATTTTTVTTTTTGTSSTTSTPGGPLPDDELPGTVFELTPVPGAVLAVIGVQVDDVLNVREAPGIDHPVIAELAPLAADFTATGRARMLTSSIWWEVTTADGIVGWVSSRFTALVGPTHDLTSTVVADLGEVPEAETMEALGLIVADAMLYDPDVPTEIVLTVMPTEGDLGEVTYDMVGLGDDAVRALRLHVFGQPLESGDGYALKSVEGTDMCESVRGVSQPDGLCA